MSEARDATNHDGSRFLVCAWTSRIVSRKFGFTNGATGVANDVGACSWIGSEIDGESAYRRIRFLKWHVKSRHGLPCHFNDTSLLSCYIPSDPSALPD